MDHPPKPNRRRDLAPAAILAIIVAYGIALCVGWPQSGTERVISQQHELATSHSDAGAASAVTAPPFWAVLPFVLLLAGIAVLPLIPRTSHWWESTLNRFKVAGGLALLTIAYSAVLHSGAIEGHWPAHHVVVPAASGVQTGFVSAILANAM